MRRQNESPPPRQRGRAEGGSLNNWPIEYSETSKNSQSPAIWHLADAAWFAAHPARNYRIRPVMQGEIANLADELGIDAGFHPPGTTIKIIARRPELGEPLRYPAIEPNDAPCDRVSDFEPFLQAVFETGFEGMALGRSFVPGHVLTTRIKRLAAAAGIS
jgi:hypothetical protein